MIYAAGLDALFELPSNINLQLQPGELVALCGPPHAGKSALLRLLAGELMPSRGSLSMDGRPLAYLNPALRERSLALAAPLPKPGPNLSLEQVVALGRQAHEDQTDGLEDEVVISAAMEWVGLAHFSQRCYRDLTPAEQVQVLFARAAAQIWEQPPTGNRYLLMDRPPTGLDLWTQQRLLRLCQELVKETFGVLAVLDDLVTAARFADRLICLDQGRIVFQGPVAQVPDRLLRPNANSFFPAFSLSAGAWKPSV